MHELYSALSKHMPKGPHCQKNNWLVMGCTAALILLRDVGGIGVSRVVFIGLAAIACLLTDKSGIYCLLAFLTPLSSGISYTYITAIALVILLCKENLRLRVQIGGLLCMAGILFLEFFSAFRGMFSLMEYLRFVGVFVCCFLRMLDLRNDYDNEGILHGYLFGYWTAMASILGQMLRFYPLRQFLSLGVRFGNTRDATDVAEGMLISYNPNILGVFCLLAALFCLLLYRKDKKRRYLVSFCGATLLGVMTQSRTFLLVYVMAIFLYALLSCKNVKTAVQSVLALAAGGIIMVFAALWLVPEYVESLLLRFQAADLSNGRFSIAAYYFQEMFQHADRILFGVGLQNYPDKYGYFISSHNATQEVLIAWGFLGLFLVLVLLLGVFWNGYRHNPRAKLVQYLPVLMCLLYTQAGQGFRDAPSMLRLMVAYSAILLPLEGGNPLYESVMKYLHPAN